MKLRIWIKEIRPEFLILSPVLVLLGTSVSLNTGYFNLAKFFLTTIGLLLAHSSVNTLNDYFDFKSGIDTETTPTAFSGGSGITRYRGRRRTGADSTPAKRVGWCAIFLRGCNDE